MGEKYKKSSRVKLYNCCNDYSGLRNRGQYTVTKVRTAARTIAGFQLCDLKTDKKMWYSQRSCAWNRFSENTPKIQRLWLTILTITNAYKGNNKNRLRIAVLTVNRVSNSTTVITVKRTTPREKKN